MAWMNQEKKAKIAAELKKVMPSTWKWSLSVKHHSTIRLTISAAPINLIAHHKKNEYFTGLETHIQLNEYHLEHAYEGALLETFKRIKDALNTDNHDRSDIMTDYFDVGHYVDIEIGRWNRPFQVITTETPSQELARLKAQVAAMA
jgi:hypothetical protein